MIQIYGSPRTSASRCHLMLEEIGIPYKTVPLDMMLTREHKSEAFLMLNPNGKVPVLIDDNFVIWESLAINSYLADKYKPELLGKSPEERGSVQQWSIWATSDLQSPMIEVLIQLLFTPENKRDLGAIAKAQDKISILLKILDQTLENKNYLIGNKFTLADLNVASVAGITETLKMSLDQYPHVNTWLENLKNRPAFNALAALRAIKQPPKTINK
jgi:glutathione S-transferase